jgi:hypothetical protein
VGSTTNQRRNLVSAKCRKIGCDEQIMNKRRNNLGPLYAMEKRETVIYVNYLSETSNDMGKERLRVMN